MRGVLAFLFCFAFCAAIAQREPSNFGDVNHADFQPGPFPDASSVVLFDLASMYYEVYQGEIYPKFTRHLRVRINTHEGFAKWGNFVLGHRYLRVNKIRAATYTLENGLVVAKELDKDQIIKDRRNTNERIFSLPNVTEGCVIEISYSGSYSLSISPNWVVQSDVPVLWSEYILGNVGMLTNVIYGGIRPAIFDQQYRGHYTRWVFKNVPAFAIEKNMGSPKPYYGRLEFALPDKTWQHISEKYAVDYQFHRARVPPWPLTRLARELTAGMASDLQKAKAISDYVKRNFTWNGISDWVSDIHHDILERKSGSSADLNHLVNTMLLQVGLKPRLLLLSTRSNGEILKEVPSITQFNNVISALTIDGQEYFIDSTDPMLPFGVLPEDCVNVDAMEAREKNANWIRIESAAFDKVNVTARLTLTSDLTLKGRVSILSHGYAARNKRAAHQVLGEKKYFESNLTTRQWENDSVRAINADKPDQPFQEVYYANISGHVQGTQDKLYLDPFILLREDNNPWKAEQRRYPMDMGFPSEKLLVVTLTIPEEYEVESIPATEAFSTPDNAIACGFKVLQNNNILVISFQHVTSRSLFPAESYAALREFFNRMITKSNEPIVLRKKAGQ